MVRLKIVFLGAVLLMASAGVSWGAFILVGGPGAKGEQRFEESKVWGTSTVEEAEEIAGYRLAEPAFLPPGFAPTGSILIQQPAGRSGVELPRSVTRGWVSRDGSAAISLEQHPGLAGIGGENVETVTVNGFPGQRRLLPAQPPHRLLPIVSFFWTDGKFGYVLSGTVTDTLSEDVILKIAESVRLEE